MSKFYLTTSIAYVNAPPHIGYALELTQADVIARWRRQQGDDVFFLTGTDEHGAKIARAAAEAGKTPRQLVDENAARFQALKDILNISWDDFIQTSDQKRHWPNVIEVWQKLAGAGDIYKKNYQGLYCVGHEAFVTEKDLENGLCRDHQTKPEIIEEENYFFRLSKYAPLVAERIKSGQLKIVPQHRANEILSFISQGVEDISFSRPRKDLQWGIPVPGDETQTIYVWADALTNYLYPKDRWPADVHFIGKDILRFHALYWPAMLLSAGLSLPKTIFVHGFIMVEGKKMSKSLGNVIDPVELVNKYGADAVRYYLLREIPAVDDGDFSIKKFEERYNADLANGLGNFSARVLALAGIDANIRINANDMNKYANTKIVVEQKLSQFKFNEALAAIWDLIASGDKFINDNKLWETKDQQKIGEVLAILDAVADLIQPFLPATAEKISAQGGSPPEADAPREHASGGKAHQKTQLFPRI